MGCLREGKLDPPHEGRRVKAGAWISPCCTSLMKGGVQPHPDPPHPLQPSDAGNRRGAGGFWAVHACTPIFATGSALPRISPAPEPCSAPQALRHLSGEPQPPGEPVMPRARFRSTAREAGEGSLWQSSEGNSLRQPLSPSERLLGCVP